ncbi:MAG: hypothetical protein QOK07_1686 [Gemmatimonadaceae bacterium]|jgi:hypothetical protein|nr:hypothetical protein [Gemmatimonadaceae bacterium]
MSTILGKRSVKLVKQASIGGPYLGAALTPKATNLQLIKMENSGHFVAEEQPEVVARALIDFFHQSEMQLHRLTTNSRRFPSRSTTTRIGVPFAAVALKTLTFICAAATPSSSTSVSPSRSPARSAFEF